MLRPSVAQARPSRDGKALPVILAAVLALGVAGVLAWRRLGAAPAAEHAAAPRLAPPDPGVLEPDPFVLNLADPAGDRFVRIRMSLVLDQKTVVARAGEGLGEVKLRDRVLSVLSRKRASQLTTSEGRELVRQEVAAAVEGLMDEAPFHQESDPFRAHVQDVLFLEFLVQ